MQNPFKSRGLVAVVVVYAALLACKGGGSGPCENGVQDNAETDIDCGGVGGNGGGGSCFRCREGKRCSVTTDCADQMYCASGVCVQATCTDNVKNRDEPDTDCGGHFCPRCVAGKACSKGEDCDSFTCTSGVCAAGNCSDTFKDQGESDVDCGGASSCARCPNGKRCTVGTDCATGICGSMNTCADFNCYDQLQDGDESDVDCGGTFGCPRCNEGMHCHSVGDCNVNSCVNEVCTTSDLCVNHQLDSGEIDVDCGNGICPACEADKHCLNDGNCASNHCQNGFCQEPTCSDQYQNQGEVDVDCGGPCPKCPNGSHCEQNLDCLENTCGTVDFQRVCLGPTCHDGFQNGNETDRDCGGSCAANCAPGQHCLVTDDCDSSFCINEVCAQVSCTDHVANGNETDVDCGGPCLACSNGLLCTGNGDCRSGFCNASHRCAQPTCNDHVKNGGESDVDCGGVSCLSCDTGLVCFGNADCATNACNGHCFEASCSDHMMNGWEAGVDCGGPCATKCPLNTPCHHHEDCDSGTCGLGYCITPACTGQFQDANETDVNCGGVCSAKCQEHKGCVVSADCFGSLVCSGNLCSQPHCGNGLKDSGEVGVDCGGECRPCLTESMSVSCNVGGDCVSGYCDTSNGSCQPQDVLIAFSHPIDGGAIANVADLAIQFNQPIVPSTMITCVGRDSPRGCNVMLQDSYGGFVPIWIYSARATPPLVDWFYIGHPRLLDIVQMSGDYKLTILGGDVGPHGFAGGTSPGDQFISFRCSSG
jgi:hypothetical protein